MPRQLNIKSYISSVLPYKNNIFWDRDFSGKTPVSNAKQQDFITGWKFHLVSGMMAINLFWLALKKYKYPWRAFRMAMKVINRRESHRTTYHRLAKLGSRFCLNLNTPGWPSAAFNRFALHLMNIYSPRPEVSLFTLIFAITNKCGFHCEHCAEWNRLNGPDQLSAGEISEIINRFHSTGLSQVQFSGGEPLLRLPDILQVLDSMPTGIDSWIYTNGYHVTEESVRKLRQHGLTGMIFSLDHHEPEKHDHFRGKKGSFRKVMEGASLVYKSGMGLAFSCCATQEFVSRENLAAYARLCRHAGASFIQILEPVAIGRYEGKDVSLDREKQLLIEEFYEKINYDRDFRDYPIVFSPGMLKRIDGCPGAGNHVLYVDSDGDVHACPFCHKKLFPANDPGLEKNIGLLKQKGCSMLFDKTVHPRWQPYHQSLVPETVPEVKWIA